MRSKSDAAGSTMRSAQLNLGHYFQILEPGCHAPRCDDECLQLLWEFPSKNTDNYCEPKCKPKDQKRQTELSNRKQLF